MCSTVFVPRFFGFSSIQHVASSIDCHCDNLNDQAEQQPKMCCIGETQLSSSCQAPGEPQISDLLEGLRGTRHRAEEGPLVRECQEESKPESGVLGAMGNSEKNDMTCMHVLMDIYIHIYKN